MTLAAAFGLALLTPAPAFAHHAMGGGTPRTLADGLLSGLAHPIIGIDHLAFLVGAGLLAGMFSKRGAIGAIALFVGAGLMGTLLHLAGIGIGPVEAMVAISCILAGLALVRGGALKPGLIGLGFALAGLFHGHAFAEAVVGSETTPVIAYLAGLALVQFALAGAVAFFARDAALARRVGGAAVAAVGAVALAMVVMA